MQGEVDIKQFAKQKRINKGSFGFVYQIQDKKTGENYAAKIIDCDDDGDKCNEMVNREVNIMLHTKHPTIIKFIGYSKVDFQGENNVTIIMELAKNGSLRDEVVMGGNLFTVIVMLMVILFFWILVMLNKCHFSVVMIMQQQYVIKAKLFSSTVLH